MKKKETKRKKIRKHTETTAQRGRRWQKAGKISGIVLFSLAVLFVLLWIILPTGPRETMEFDDPYRTERDAVHADEYLVSTGNPWTTQAAVDVLEQGGNAFDAAAAALLTLNVTYGEAASFPGVSPLLIYDADTDSIIGYNGAGTAPARATLERYLEEGHETVPVMHMWAQLLPASPDMIIALLQEHGTMSFSELSRNAIETAREGFPVHSMMLNNMGLGLIERFGYNILMPYNVDVYLGGQWWRGLHHKERFTRPDLADTLQAMADAEMKAVSENADRETALDAVRAYFYEGPIAETIADFHEQEGGLFTLQDLAEYTGYWEEPLSGTFEDYTIYANQTWSQGALVPHILQILEGIDLKSMGHNSPEYMHTVLQAIQLAIADREAYFGDPNFVDVPIETILSKEYALQRRSAMTPAAAFTNMPAPGKIDGYAIPKSLSRLLDADSTDADSADADDINGQQTALRDTSYISIVDGEGNAVSLTPSDFPKSPMVPGTGLTLGVRMTQFRLEPDHPAVLEPGKRPRITPNPGMVTKDGEFFMTFGTPGGDMQTQAMVQVFLNLTLWGMDIQDAIDAPRFKSLNHPDSFAPHEYKPGTILLEKPLYQVYADEMKDYGYKVEQGETWDYHFGAVCAVMRDPATGELIGGADPREESWADGR